jgi:hypothetical protein
LGSFWIIGDQSVTPRIDAFVTDRPRDEGDHMSQQAKFEANRINAKRSTGPKTTSGKARSSMNARKHGSPERAS